MQKRELAVINELGIHARPAQNIVKIATKFKNTEFFIEKNGDRINGKSIMGVLMLAAECGSSVIIEADGDNEIELLDKVEELFKAKFYEEVESEE
jgi:phosphocarrier protein HPr